MITGQTLVDVAIAAPPSNIIPPVAIPTAATPHFGQSPQLHSQLDEQDPSNTSEVGWS